MAQDRSAEIIKLVDSSSITSAQTATAGKFGSRKNLASSTPP